LDKVGTVYFVFVIRQYQDINTTSIPALLFGCSLQNALSVKHQCLNNITE